MDGGSWDASLQAYFGYLCLVEMQVVPSTPSTTLLGQYLFCHDRNYLPSDDSALWSGISPTSVSHVGSVDPSETKPKTVDPPLNKWPRPGLHQCPHSTFST